MSSSTGTSGSPASKNFTGLWKAVWTRTLISRNRNPLVVTLARDDGGFVVFSAELSDGRMLVDVRSLSCPRAAYGTIPLEFVLEMADMALDFGGDLTHALDSATIEGEEDD